MSATDRKIEYYMERDSRKWALQGGLLRIARGNKKATQNDIASLCFVKEQQYSAWERGTSPVPTRHLRNVCAALGLDQEALAKTMARDYQLMILRNAVKQ